jgi:hypothetical protein
VLGFGKFGRHGDELAANLASNHAGWAQHLAYSRSNFRRIVYLSKLSVQFPVTTLWHICARSQTFDSSEIAHDKGSYPCYHQACLMNRLSTPAAAVLPVTTADPLAPIKRTRERGILPTSQRNAAPLQMESVPHFDRNPHMRSVRPPRFIPAQTLCKDWGA